MVREQQSILPAVTDKVDSKSVAEKVPMGTEFFVTCHPGFEDVLASELQDLGLSTVQISKAGVSFWSERSADGVRACLWLRSAIRVLMLLSRQNLSTDVARGIRSGDSVSFCIDLLSIHVFEFVYMHTHVSSYICPTALIGL